MLAILTNLNQNTLQNIDQNTLQNIGKYIGKQILEYWYRWPINYRQLVKHRRKNFDNIYIGFKKK